MTDLSSENAPPIRTRRAIMDLLKREGPTDSRDLAGRLGVTAMAVRQHLYDLQKSRLVSFKETPRPLGRPAKLWSLTPAADQFFPDGHAQVTLDLINTIKQTFGEESLNRVIKERGQKQLEAYRKRIPASKSLRGKLDALAGTRTGEGYMAEVQPQKDGSFLLIENHCPICAAAKSCTGFCSSELTVFRTVLGKGAEVERTEHIVSGARRCVYKVTPTKNGTT